MAKSYSPAETWNPTTSLVSPSTLDLSKKYSSGFNPNQWAKFFVPSGDEAPLVPALPSSAVPFGNISQTVKDQLDFYKGIQPELASQRASEYAQQAELTRKQLSDVFPYMAAASSQATARNLAASKQFLAFKEGSPTAQAERNVLAQNQMASAADSEYRRAMGIAAQQQAAQGGLRFAGQTFQVG